jgi:hypothetical protein
VSHAVQAQLPSAKYLGHNLYAATLELFAQRLEEQPKGPATDDTAAVDSTVSSPPTGDDANALDAAARGGAAAAATSDAKAAADDLSASAAELNFLAVWRQRGAPAVVISYVAAASASVRSGAAAAVDGSALATLRHELCHARFALLPRYKRAVEAAWAGPHGAAKLEKWLGALVRERGRRCLWCSQLRSCLHSFCRSPFPVSLALSIPKPLPSQSQLAMQHLTS